MVAREGFESRKVEGFSKNLDTSERVTDEKTVPSGPKVGGLDQRLDQPLRGKAVGDGEPVDPVEGALSTALAAAASAGQWTVVETLARELEARRTARAAVKSGAVIESGQRHRREAAACAVRGRAWPLHEAALPFWHAGLDRPAAIHEGADFSRVSGQSSHAPRAMRGRRLLFSWRSTFRWETSRVIGGFPAQGWSGHVEADRMATVYVTNDSAYPKRVRVT